ncbi:MAG: dienelactone hydrolase family protein [Dehalococcoidia bacterium]|jgi:carboxymethylenebutenolidase|nr:dienelactone hydrolase family protein [Dehalococcoidia bacterium]
MAKYEGMLAETVLINGHNGDQIDAYLARPLGGNPVGAVVLIHHMPGWDEASKEMARKLAYNGFATISPNLHFRQGQATPQDNSASIRDAGGMPDDRTMADVQAAIDYLRTLPYTNGKVGIIGFCSGGRQVVLGACTLEGVDAAVNCWGGGVTPRDSEPPTPAMPKSPIDFISYLSCPLLGLFGNDDARPSPEEVNVLEAALKANNKTYEFHRYDNAGHGFFAVDRPSYAQEAAVAGWGEALAWFNKYLGGGAGANGQGAAQVPTTARA